MGIKDEFENEFPKGSLIHNPALEGAKWMAERCAKEIVNERVDVPIGIAEYLADKVRRLSKELSDGK